MNIQYSNQSLAGRAAILNLYGLSMAELAGRRPLDPARLERAPARFAAPAIDRDRILFSGLYPRIHAQGLNARDWLNGYVRTYVERDVREILNVGDLEAFSRFIVLAAGQTAQLLNFSSLASDCGISHVTARRWISVLEASGILVLVRPHHANLRKRVIKAPKLYFLDPGLVCFLLGVRSAEELNGHPLHGAIFETFVVSELYKAFAHRGERPPLHFFRDRTGHEVDVVIELGRRRIAVEVKLTRTVRLEAFRGLDFYRALAGGGGGVLVYGGEDTYRHGRHLVRSWAACS